MSHPIKISHNPDCRTMGDAILQNCTSLCTAPRARGAYHITNTTGPEVMQYKCRRCTPTDRASGVCLLIKVATDTNILDLRTRYRTKLGWFFWFWPIQRYDTTMGKWQSLYLRTRYRSKLGWFFWFGPIHLTIRRNLAER